MAFPAENVVTEVFIGNQWEEVTEDVLGEISISRGRSSEQGAPSPSSMSLTLRDDARPGREAGRYVNRNPLSAYYGELTRNTPIRTLIRPGITSGDADLADVSDTFTRSVSNGWGTSTSGATWGTTSVGSSNASDWNVNGTQGTHYVDAANEARLSYPTGTWLRNFDVAVTFTCPLATGNNLEPANIHWRYSPSTAWSGMTRIEITPAAEVNIKVFGWGPGAGTLVGSTTTSITHLGEVQPLRMRTRSTGRQIWVKVWRPLAESEPTGWTYVALDTADERVGIGMILLRSGRATGNTNTGNPQFAYDDFSITAEVARFTGEVPEWNPAADITNRAAVVGVRAAGVLERLTAGAKPLESAVKRYITRKRITSAYAYWPFEDGSSAARWATGKPGFDAITIGEGMGSPAADGDSFPGSAPLAKLGTAYFATPPISMPSTGLIAVGCLIAIPAAGLLDSTPLFDIQQGGSSTIVRWELRYQTVGGGSLLLQGLDSSNATVVTTAAITFDMNGKAAKVAVNLQQNGSNVDYGIYVTSELVGLVATGTFNSVTTGSVWRIRVNLLGQAEDITFGHLVLSGTSTEVSQFEDSPFGYAGETATDRIIRLCDEEGVLYEIEGSPQSRMGPQRIATLFDNLHDVELVDQGILGEPPDFVGLYYIGRTALYNQTPSATLSVADHDLAEPLRPRDDLANAVNQMTVSRYGGSSGMAELTSGPMSTMSPPDGIGLYDRAITVAAYEDGDVIGIAGHLVALGTAEDFRFPGLTVDFVRKPITNSWVQVALAGEGRVLALADLPDWLPPDEMLLMVRGMDETIANSTGSRGWRVTWKTSPARPYSVALVAEDGDTADEFRVDAEDSTIGAVNSTATAMTVTSTGYVWSTAAADYPQAAMVGGEEVSITAMSGASSPQTATVVRSDNGVVKAHAAGTQLRPKYPAVVTY